MSNNVFLIFIQFSRLTNRILSAVLLGVKVELRRRRYGGEHCGKNPDCIGTKPRAGQTGLNGAEVLTGAVGLGVGDISVPSSSAKPFMNMPASPSNPDKSGFWARAYYAMQRAKGKGHHAAVRALAFKWIRIIWNCWQTRTPYSEVKYLESLRKKGSPLLAYAAAHK